MFDFEEKLKNGLECRIDWLSFTVLDLPLVRALEVFGFSLGDFVQSPKGSMGYKKMLLLTGSKLRVLYDGADGMGIHFDISGSAISDFYSYCYNHYAIESPFGGVAVDWDFASDVVLEKVLRYGHVTRLDLALDNKHDIYFRLPELESILDSGRFVSKFRKWKSVREKDTAGELIGHTVYLGSRSSDIMLRVYNKQLEKSSSEEKVDYEWIRWELELKDERATQAVRCMVDQKKDVGEVCVGILENYFRIIIKNCQNKSRCSTDIKWQRFIDDIQGLRLYVPNDSKTLEDKRDWIMRQVMPTLTGLIIANYGDISFLSEHMELHAGRMKHDLRDLVTAANPGWVEALHQLSQS